MNKYRNKIGACTTSFYAKEIVLRLSNGLKKAGFSGKIWGVNENSFDLKLKNNFIINIRVQMALTSNFGGIVKIGQRFRALSGKDHLVIFSLKYLKLGNKQYKGNFAPFGFAYDQTEIDQIFSKAWNNPQWTARQSKIFVPVYMANRENIEHIHVDKNNNRSLLFTDVKAKNRTAKLIDRELITEQRSKGVIIQERTNVTKDISARPKPNKRKVYQFK